MSYTLNSLKIISGGLAIYSHYTPSEGLAIRLVQIPRYDHHVHHNSILYVELLLLLFLNEYVLYAQKY